MNNQNQTNTGQMETDQAYEATLLARLGIAPGLSEVHATVKNGVAMLSGEVQEEIDVKRAVLIAEAVEGVKEVNQKIRVVGTNKNDRDAYFKPVEGISSSPQITRDTEGDYTPIDEALNDTTVVDENNLATSILEGMVVFDSEGNKVGKVRMVRTTDFLLSRFLSKDYYVPYFVCTMQTDGVHLNVKGSEMKDQGWASPHQETP